MTVNYCDHCGKVLARISDRDSLDAIIDESAGFVLREGETYLLHSKLMLCKKCLETYIETRKNFDIEFFTPVNRHGLIPF